VHMSAPMSEDPEPADISGPPPTSRPDWASGSIWRSQPTPSPNLSSFWAHNLKLQQFKVDL
jgi:hypothetical protein